MARLQLIMEATCTMSTAALMSKLQAIPPIKTQRTSQYGKPSNPPSATEISIDVEFIKDVLCLAKEFPNTETC